jgi:hypothetical protein
MARSDEMVMQEPAIARQASGRQARRQTIAWACWLAGGAVGLHRFYLRAPSAVPLLALPALLAGVTLLRRGRRLAFVALGVAAVIWLREALILPRLLQEQSTNAERELAAQRISLERDDSPAPSAEVAPAEGIAS